MATLNRAMLIGRLTKDPNPVRAMGASGARVISFRLAVGRSRKNPDTGAWENDPNPLYIDCEVMTGRDGNSRLLDVVQNYLRKGSEVYVEGRLTLSEWDNKEGQKVSVIRLNVSEIQLLGARQDGSGGGSTDHDEYEERPAPPPRRSAPATAGRSNGTHSRPASKPAPPPSDIEEEQTEDDIPF